MCVEQLWEALRKFSLTQGRAQTHSGEAQAMNEFSHSSLMATTGPGDVVSDAHR